MNRMTIDRDIALRRVVANLIDFNRETIERYITDTSDYFGESRIASFVPLLVERFTRERLRALAQVEGLMARTGPEVLFVCVHNAGRSQMAAALTDALSGGKVHVRSAGSDPGEHIHNTVVAVMGELGLDIAKEFPKPLTDEVVEAAGILGAFGSRRAPCFGESILLTWS